MTSLQLGAGTRDRCQSAFPKCFENPRRRRRIRAGHKSVRTKALSEFARSGAPSTTIPKRSRGLLQRCWPSAPRTTCAGLPRSSPRADTGAPQTAPRPHRAVGPSARFIVSSRWRCPLSRDRERTPESRRKPASAVSQVPANVQVEAPTLWPAAMACSRRLYTLRGIYIL